MKKKSLNKNSPKKKSSKQISQPANLGGTLFTIAGVAFIITIIVIEMLVMNNSVTARNLLATVLLLLFIVFLGLLGLFFLKIRAQKRN